MNYRDPSQKSNYLLHIDCSEEDVFDARFQAIKELIDEETLKQIMNYTEWSESGCIDEELVRQILENNENSSSIHISREILDLIHENGLDLFETVKRINAARVSDFITFNN